MRTRISACLIKLEGSPAPKSLAPLLLILLIALFAPAPASADDSVILDVVLNEEAKGEHFAFSAADGDFIFKIDDLKSMGMRDPKGAVSLIDGEQYIYLRSIEGLEFEFDDKKLAIKITVPPYLLSKMVISLLPENKLKVFRPNEKSFFMNYRVSYAGQDAGGWQNLDLIDKVGFRSGDYLFTSDSSYRRGPFGSKFVRLQSAFSRENRDALEVITAGDQFAYSGELGTSLNLGGIGFSKIFTMDPYFIKQPMFNISGLTAMPSDVEIYLDGALISKQKISPGEFELSNINFYGGVKTMEIVIKDPFGKVQRIIHPFYFTDMLLKEGLHEYSYNIGAIRRLYGTESDEYRGVGFSSYHRYGLSDHINIGVRAEGGNDVYNAGPQLSYVLTGAGVFTLNESNSFSPKSPPGYALSANHSFQSKLMSTRLMYKTYSPDYATASGPSAHLGSKREIGAGVAFWSANFGSITLDYSSLKRYGGYKLESASATYSVDLRKDMSGFLTLRGTGGSDSNREIFVGLNYYPDRKSTVSTNYHSTDAQTDESIQYIYGNSQTEGANYRLTVNNQDYAEGGAKSFSPFAQYNGRYGIYTADYSYRDAGDSIGHSYSASAAGAIVYVGDDFAMTRPVSDSFSFVKVGDLKDVRVFLNNEEVGKTDSAGKVVMPEMKAYQNNLVSFSDKDIGMNYYMPSMNIYLSPGIWGGSCVMFDAIKVQGYTGILKVERDADIVALEYVDVAMDLGVEKITFITGEKGEFYFENIINFDEKKPNTMEYKGCKAFEKIEGLSREYRSIKPGKYKAHVEYRGRECTFEISIPVSEDVMVELGEYKCVIE